ncbi:diacylglycerol kinase family protein [Parafrigoribacterium mesophilum]|uniref:diacylglycerol/lipid kinase family protein n=1 Tax=Parafrigoribacterium mesophilum TaxID=433646 RepID=UPI0031FCEFA0
MAAPSAPARQIAAVVYNPIKVDLPKLEAAVLTAEQRAGWGTTLWFATTTEDTGEAAAKLAVRQGADVVLVAGGDGTVRGVAQGLRGSRIPLTLLPSGTGNLLARNLGLVLNDLDSSVGNAFTGADRTIDLGVVELARADGEHEEHVFVVMAGLGIDAKMIALTNSKLKKAVGWLAYVDASVRAIPELEPVRLSYRLDDGPQRPLTAHTVIIGNCGSLPGGILLMPDAKPDDGILDVAALRPRGPFGWLKVWNKLLWENGVLRKSAVGRRIIDLTRDVRDVSYFTCRDLTLEVEAAQAFQLDGDEFGEVVSVHTHVDAGALTVKVPV